jgi:hypothetical protein
MASPFDDLFQSMRERDLPSWWIDSLKAAERGTVLNKTPAEMAGEIVGVLQEADVDTVRALRSIGSPDWNQYLQQFGWSKSQAEAVSQGVEARLTGSSSSSGSSGSSSGGSSSSGTGSQVTGPGTARRTQNASLLGGTGPKIVGAVALAGAAAYAGRDWLREKLS